MDNQKIHLETNQSSNNPSNLRMDEELGYIDVIPPSFGTVEYFQSQFSTTPSSDLPFYNLSTSPVNFQHAETNNTHNLHQMFPTEHSTNIPSYELFGNSRFWSPAQTNVTSSWNLPSFTGYGQDRSWLHSGGSLPHYSSQHDLAWMQQQQQSSQRWDTHHADHYNSTHHGSHSVLPFNSMISPSIDLNTQTLSFESNLGASPLEESSTMQRRRTNQDWPSNELKDAPSIKNPVATAPLGVAPKPLSVATKASSMTRRAPCKFFSSGGCKNGDKCPFAHEKEDQPARPSRICKYFAGGFCREGSQCPFLHPPPSSPPVQPRERSNSLNSLPGQPTKSESAPELPTEPQNKSKPAKVDPLPTTDPQTRKAKETSAQPAKVKSSKKSQAVEDTPQEAAPPVEEKRKREPEPDKEKEPVLPAPPKREKKKKKVKGNSHSDSDLPAPEEIRESPPELIQDQPAESESEADIPELISDDEMPDLVTDDEDTIEEQYQHQLLTITETQRDTEQPSWGWSFSSDIRSQDQVIQRIAKSKDHYQVLNVTRDAQLRLIQHQYRKLASLLHANNTETSQRALEVVTEAFSLLSDPRKRLEYDVLLQNGQGELNIQLGDIESSLPSMLSASRLRSSKIGRLIMLFVGLLILGLLYCWRVVKLLFCFVRAILPLRSKKHTKWCQACKEYHTVGTEEGEIFEVNGHYFTRRAGTLVDVTEFIKRVTHACQEDGEDEKSSKKKGKKKAKQAK